MSHSPAGNNTDVASVCRLVPSLLNKPQLSEIYLGHSPSACVGCDAWLQAGLPVPPGEVVRKGWEAVLRFLSFDDNLRLALDCSAQLPPQLHLGQLACSWTNGKLKYEGSQPGFRRLTADELRQLARRLHAAPQHRVVFLNLHDHRMGSDVMQEMAPAIAALDALQVLILYGNYYLPFV